ncbi:MAG: hypothetical protein ACYCXQ_05880 [Candidatus Humimicrobiaceae bacterium]
MSLELSKEMASIIKEKVGISLDDMRKQTIEEIEEKVEKKIGRKLTFGYEPGYIPRGNILIQNGRIILPEEIEEKFNSVFKTT